MYAGFNKSSEHKPRTLIGNYQEELYQVRRSHSASPTVRLPPFPPLPPPQHEETGFSRIAPFSHPAFRARNNVAGRDFGCAPVDHSKVGTKPSDPDTSNAPGPRELAQEAEYAATILSESLRDELK